MSYFFYITKRYIEDIVIFPFVVLGRIISKFRIPHNQYDIIFIFPFYHTGGAEKVHLEIAKVFNKKKCLILFTRKSSDTCFKKSFEEIGHDIIDISQKTDNKFAYWNNLIWRGIVSAMVHSQDMDTVVFNGQSNFGYKLSRWVNSQYTQVELIHSFNSFSWIRIPFIQYYSKTVMISHKAIEEHQIQYKNLNVPSGFINHIQYINNGIQIDNAFIPQKSFNNKLNVLYVGRATSEKRPELFCKIAQNAYQHELPFQFEMAGNMSPYLDSMLTKNILLHGSIQDNDKMKSLYDNADIVMITSSEEGFPLVIMEAMARGCVIVSTPVGDIPYHVKNGENGFLFSVVNSEQQIIDESKMILSNLFNNREVLNQLSTNNTEYAKKVFGLDKFAESYYSLLESIKA